MARQAAKLKAAADGLRLAKRDLEQSLAAKDLLVHELSQPIHLPGDDPRLASERLQR